MLTIPLSTLGWIIVKARAFDSKDVDADDPTFDELTSWISDLNDFQKAELVAVFWLGRDDGDASDFAGLLTEAQSQQGKSTARYLLGSPLLGDYLEEGLERLGIGASEIESALG